MAENKHEEAVAQVAKSAQSFTNDFHKNVAGKTDGNFVSSALSAHVVLAMAAYGADGKTKEEMQRTLHLPEKDEVAHEGFQHFLHAINNVPDVILKIANKIYGASDLKIKDRFLEITGKHFHSECSKLDFSKAKESADEVNNWCVEKTNGKIKDLLTEGDVTSDTRMILLNAVYFKGKWLHKFHEEATEPKPFHVNKTTTVDVPTMHITKKFFYKDLKELNAEVVALPYENEDLALVIIVPKEIDGLKQVEDNLEKIQIDEHDLKRYKREINLALPKFKIETTIDLNQHLDELGMSTMFTDKADFSGIASESLKVSKVLQKAFIEVNEEGSEAAAVTDVRMVLKCASFDLTPPIVLNVDKPFVYKIVYQGKPLFSGHVVNPLQ
ncbi:antichymotrypsin-2 isoform X1 [Nasonia vitripennis]|uniref:Serpin domain-containing protein n=1 Tax=Nasonia vitripennis TaxID=7425 RepID=A0A7M7QY50_NASVI|nr:antichymotrypsin-2 isoform X1 [Nasonia vitripennis]XP_032456306.1 antichymotrypsin-2 isoform X1 [Nasonia vitripennis]